MRKISERVLCRGNWLALKESTFESNSGVRFAWESVERLRSSRVVIVCARLVPSDRIVLIGQYRPVIGNRVLALPAGFVDAPDPATEALRELEEETGFSGIIRGISPPLVVNSALITDRLQLVSVDVDETDPRNANPRQRLEPSEEIEVFAVPRSGVRDFILEKSGQGYDVGSGLWYMFCANGGTVS